MRLAGFGLALFCLFFSNSSASAQQPAQNQPIELRKAYCKAWSSDQATIYFSDVFEINVPYNLGTRGIENLFETYLKQSYGYNSTPLTPVILVLSESVAASEKSKQQDQAQYTMMGKQLVETRWKLSRQQAAAVSLIPAPPQCYDALDAKKPGCEQILHPAAPGGAGTPATPGASAAANPNPFLYELCRAMTSVMTGGKRTTYFSDIMPRANINDADYSAAFAAFLAKKYGLQYVTPECGASRSQADARNWMEEGWWKVNPNFSTAVQTGWTYSPADPRASPAPAAPAASAAPTPPTKNVSVAPVPSTRAPATPQSPASQPAPSAAATTPNVTHAVCWADFDPHTRYYSAVFDGTVGDYNVWMPAFKTFLEQKYRYTGLVRCTKRPDKADAQKYLDNMVSTARGMTLGDGSKAKVIETSWQYK